jgi:Domain of Unknown Function (DUF930)
MLQTPNRSRLIFTLGILASVSAHAMILALLILDLPQLRPEPEEPKSIQVELVPPKEEMQQEPQQKTRPAATLTSDHKKIASADKANVQSPQMLRPVHKFGEKDAGQRKSGNGNAVSEVKAAGASPSEEPAKKPDTPEKTASAPVPKPDSVAVRPAVHKPLRLAENNKTMDSQLDNERPVATTAMGAVPRGIRAGELCATELRDQLRNSIPPYLPDLLPAYRLEKGTILQVRKGAFRANARWYNLRFRCEVDEAATRVVSFGFDVGAPVPRAEWISRGFPSS